MSCIASVENINILLIDLIGQLSHDDIGHLSVKP